MKLCIGEMNEYTFQATICTVNHLANEVVGILS